MRIFYNANNTNFGDHLNSWLWPRIIPDIIESHDDHTLVGIGSLLKADLDRVPGHKIIFGTGSGYGPPPAGSVKKRWMVYGVRGPLTARMFGFDPDTAITDGAWLIDQLPEYSAPPARGEEVVFVPHWSSAEMGSWREPVAMAGISYVDPLDDGPSVLQRLATARLAIVESLHGAIFADYFRTPWIAVASPKRILHFKWVDWSLSLGLEHEVLPIPPSDYLDFLLQGERPSHDMPALTTRRYTPEMFRYTPVRDRQGAGLAYRTLITLKGQLRRGRRATLEGLRRHRNKAGVGRWNAGYRETVAEYLQAIARQPGRLSDDAIRQDRLIRLSEALERFRKDLA